MSDSIILNAGNNTLAIGLGELKEYLDRHHAVTTSIDHMVIKVTGPDPFVQELLECQAYLCYPFADPSN